MRRKEKQEKLGLVVLSDDEEEDEDEELEWSTDEGEFGDVESDDETVWNEN